MKVYYSKGCAAVDAPANAVAKLGSSESNVIVFLDENDNEIAAWTTENFGPRTWAVELPLPLKAEHRRRIYGGKTTLSKSTADVIFGVGG